MFAYQIHAKNFSAKKSLLLETQHEESLAKIQALENRRPVERAAPEFVIQAPKFRVPLRNTKVSEGQLIHLETQLEPMNDPKLEVQWFHNDRPLISGHRFRTTHDFGYVALDILYAFPEGKK